MTTEIPAHDLPLWMRRAQRGVDWGVVFVIVLSLIAALPFLIQPGLPRTNASENYVFRASDYAQAISEGFLYPRWSPNVFGGYGAPIPSFYAPGPAYVPALIQFFFTGDAVSAVRVVYAASMMLAGSAMYAFVLRRSDAASGVLASALYVFSPWLVMVAPHILGDLPAVISLALLPSLLWAVDRLIVNQRGTDFLLATLCGAGLLLTHPQYGLAGFTIAAAYGLWHRFAVNRATRLHWLAIASLLAVGLSACFWLPALGEQSGVTWHRAGEAEFLSQSVGELLTPFRPVDPDELVHTPQLTLGLPLIVFTAASIIPWLRQPADTSFQRLFFGAALLFIAGAVLLPGESWLIGPVVLCLSIACTSVLKWRLPGTPLLYSLCLAAALGLSITAWTAPRGSGDFGAVDALAQVQYEQLGYGIAVLPAGSAAPSTLAPALQPNQTLVNSYTSNDIQKIGVSTQAQIGVLGHTTHSDQFQIDSSASASLRILTAYFPGWAASLNNAPLTIEPDSATGLFTVDIPSANSATLTVFLGTTPIRTVAWIVSFGALALLIVAALRRFAQPQEQFVELTLLTLPQARFTAIIVAIGGGFMLLLNAAAPSSLTAPPGYALDGSTPLRARTEVGLEALAYRLENRQVAAGGTAALTVYWRALRFLPANYRTQVLLQDLTSGERLSLSDPRHPGHYPTQRWLTNRYVTDRYRLTLPEAAAPGGYTLSLEVFDCTISCAPQNRLTFFDQEGEYIGQTLALITDLTVLR